jgi:hypothetical protein
VSAEDSTVTKTAKFVREVTRNCASRPPLAEFGEKLRAIGTAADAGVAAAVKAALEKGRKA